LTEGLHLKLVDSPNDPDLSGLSALMQRTFPDPNTVLGLDRMQEFLAANRPSADRRFCVLVAIDEERGGGVVGGSVFSHVVKSNCGFSEYILTDRAIRGQGLGRRLFDARKAVLHAAAQGYGAPGCRGLFIEVDNPRRTPADFAEAERETSLDVWERLRLFEHLGFRRVDAPYVQPPLAPDKHAIEYMDLLFAAWEPSSAERSRIPVGWLLNTVEAIWAAWTPDAYSIHLQTLKEQVGAEDVALLDPLTTG
jgi:GNAT superfamily N-acetyltransferase